MLISSSVRPSERTAPSPQTRRRRVSTLARVTARPPRRQRWCPLLSLPAARRGVHGRGQVRFEVEVDRLTVRFGGLAQYLRAVEFGEIGR